MQNFGSTVHLPYNLSFSDLSRTFNVIERSNSTTNDISFTFYYFLGAVSFSIGKFCHRILRNWWKERNYKLVKDCPSSPIELDLLSKGIYTQYKSESDLNNKQSYDQQQNSKIDDDTKNHAEESLGKQCFSNF